MKKFVVLLIALASLVSLATPVFAHSPQVLLGSREVGYLSDRDTVDVNTRRIFSQIRVCVYRHAVEFRDLDIVFGNGGRQDVAVRRVIPKGDCTRWIDLNGPVRRIDKIKFNYATFAVRSPRALVKVYGR